MVSESGASRFDAAYYKRYYEDPATRVAGRAYFDSLARFVVAYTGLLDLTVRSILDLGCGVGTLRRPLLKRLPKSTYTGVDLSPYVCDKFGWECGSVADYSSPHAFDLVICHDVVQYLHNKEANAAIRNLASLCGGVLYFSVLTREDYEENCDKARTDSQVHLRCADWYRTRLGRHFRNLGGGVYLNRDLDVAVYALEHLD